MMTMMKRAIGGVGSGAVSRAAAVLIRNNRLKGSKFLPTHRYVSSNSSGGHQAGEKLVQKDSMRGPITFASLGLMALVGGAILSYYNTEKEELIKQVTKKNMVSVGKPALGGPWVLIDHNGIPRSDANYKGRFALLYFGFTHCPDICPSELVKVGKIMEELGETQRRDEDFPRFID